MARRSATRYALESLLRIALLWGAATCASAQTQDEFFNDDSLQEIRLAMSSSYWQALKAHFDQNTYYPADVRWKGMAVRNIGVRSYGGFTRNGTKPGLRIDINRYVSNQEFLGLKAFILDNTYSDASTIRETLAMKMFARMGIPTSREAHARVYVNNEFVGSYVIVEAIDRTFVSRVYGAREADVEAGGYLFEYKNLFPYGFEYLGPNLKNYAALFEPQTRDTDAIVSLYQPIEEMIRVINESTDDDFTSDVGKYIDLPFFMKALAAEIFMVEWDGVAGFWGTNNFYLYRFRQGKPAQLIPKDRDRAFSFIDTPITLRLGTNTLTRRAMAVPGLRQVFLDALVECASLAAEPSSGDARGWLEREIDRQAQEIAPALAEDPVKPFSFEEFQADIDFLLQFARTRPPFVGCQVGLMENGSDPAAECSATLQARPSRR